MLRATMLLKVLIGMAMATSLAGCATDFGAGEVYGSTVPPTQEREEPRERGLTVYGNAFPAAPETDVAAPGRQGRGLTVYGTEYP